MVVTDRVDNLLDQVAGTVSDSFLKNLLVPGVVLSINQVAGDPGTGRTVFGDVFSCGNPNAVGSVEVTHVRCAVTGDGDCSGHAALQVVGVIQRRGHRGRCVVRDGL